MFFQTLGEISDEFIYNRKNQPKPPPVLQLNVPCLKMSVTIRRNSFAVIKKCL